MLYFYKHVDHDMDKMQKFIDFIFENVWCKAPHSGAFCLELFCGEPELKEFMTSLYYNDTKNGDFFYSHVEKIYKIFANLSPAEIDQLKIWYNSNNDIERACANAFDNKIVRYKELAEFNSELCTAIKNFFTSLWGHSQLGRKNITKVVSTVDAHYKAFIAAQKDKGVCPFCGLSRMDNEHNGTREDYDHFLPKSLYPFNSLNFKNLVPTCLKCNRTYKGSKDPLYKDNIRRKAFFPFAINQLQIEISISLHLRILSI